jgi:hypothetical protein
MLTDSQRAELEGHGSVRIKMMLAAYHGGMTGPGSAIGGFKNGDITRSDIDQWLTEKLFEESQQQTKTLFWAKMGGWTGLLGLAVAIAALVFGPWLHDWLASRF